VFGAGLYKILRVLVGRSLVEQKAREVWDAGLSGVGIDDKAMQGRGNLSPKGDFGLFKVEKI
jgi:hypothetical protein